MRQDRLLSGLSAQLKTRYSSRDRAQWLGNHPNRVCDEGVTDVIKSGGYAVVLFRRIEDLYSIRR